MPHRSITRLTEQQITTQHICISSIIIIVLILLFRKYWYVIFSFFALFLLFILGLKIIERKCPFDDEEETVIAVPVDHITSETI